MEENLLEQLRERRAKALAGGGAAKISERLAQGYLSARTRLEQLFDVGTFQESGMHVKHTCHLFGMEEREVPADGVIVGLGLVNGRLVAGISQDFTALGGTVGETHANKICEAMENAMRLGAAVVSINDSGGARIQEGVRSLSGYGRVFNKNVELSGLVPQIAIIAGPCAGGAAYSPALCDFIIMVRRTAHMFICGPEVIKASTGEAVTMDDIGSAEAHCTVSGNAHFMVDSDQEALELSKRLLSFMPSNNLGDLPHHLDQPIALDIQPQLNELIPSKSNAGFDVRKVITQLADGADFLEVHEHFAKNIVVGFARISGVGVGIVATQPSAKAGTLDIDAADKSSRFIRFCDCFNIPLVNLVDTPGFLPGVQQEKAGIIRHGAKMLFAYSAATVPKITVIMRKAYGGAYLAMCSKDLGADVVYAWPTAEVAVMGAEQAVRVLYRKQLAEANDPKAQAQEYADDYRAKFASPYEAAGAGMVTDVIEPAETRAAISKALRNLLTKRATRPPKKHGNMPL